LCPHGLLGGEVRGGNRDREPVLKLRAIPYSEILKDLRSLGLGLLLLLRFAGLGLLGARLFCGLLLRLLLLDGANRSSVSRFSSS
jgi:hypothetical protein